MVHCQALSELEPVPKIHFPLPPPWPLDPVTYDSIVVDAWPRSDEGTLLCLGLGIASTNISLCGERYVGPLHCVNPHG